MNIIILHYHQLMTSKTAFLAGPIPFPVETDLNRFNRLQCGFHGQLQLPLCGLKAEVLGNLHSIIKLIVHLLQCTSIIYKS